VEAYKKKKELVIVQTFLELWKQRSFTKINKFPVQEGDLFQIT
jgi:hypothetical protein